MASIAWLPSDGMRSKVSVAKSNSDSSLDDIASQIRPSESVPESISTTQSTVAESSRTPMKKALSKAKSAFRPLTNRKRVARPASPPRIYIGADSRSTNSAQKCREIPRVQDLSNRLHHPIPFPRPQNELNVPEIR